MGLVHSRKCQEGEQKGCWELRASGASRPFARAGRGTHLRRVENKCRGDFTFRSDSFLPCRQLGLSLLCFHCCVTKVCMILSNKGSPSARAEAPDGETWAFVLQRIICQRERDAQ